MHATGAPGARWFARTGLCCRRWDDEAVVYDESRGATHLLDADSAQVLLDLVACPGGLTVDELLGGRADEEPAAAADFTTLEAILHALRDAGLAECRPS